MQKLDSFLDNVSAAAKKIRSRNKKSAGIKKIARVIKISNA